jgi:hypothetical protein
MRIAWLICLLFPTVAPLQDVPKSPAPSPADQTEALKLIKDVFKDDYAKRAIPDRQALARKLLEQGIQSKDDLNSKFVLLREARDIASQAGDVATAMTSVDEMAKVFAVEPAALKQSVLSNAAKVAKTPDEFESLVAGSLKLVDAALAADDYDTAEKASATAAQNAKKLTDTLLLSRVSAKSKQLSEFKARFEKLKKVRETLASNPNDGPSNLVVGRFECLVKGNWAKGLPFLAKSDDSVLRPLADRELAGPKESPDQMAVADGWWELSDKEKDPGARDLARDHATEWYQKALAKLTGLSKTKVEKRMKEYQTQKLARGSWLDVTDPRLFAKTGKQGDPVELTPVKGYLQSARLQFPKGDFDGVSVRVTFDSTKAISARVILQSPQGLGMYVDAGRGNFVGGMVDQKSWQHVFDGAWAKQDEAVMAVLIGDGEFILYLNSQEMTRIKTSVNKFTHLGFEAWDGSVKFDRIQLRRLE